MGLLAGTIFAPIAWTHYSIILLVPLMVLWAKSHGRWSLWVKAAVLLLFALTVRPLAMNMDLETVASLTLVHSEFYAGVLCLVTLLTVAWLDEVAAEADGKASLAVPGS